MENDTQRVKISKRTIVLGLITAGLIIGGIAGVLGGLGFFGAIWQPDAGEEPVGDLGYNATIKISIPYTGNSDITPICEVKLYQTYDQSNLSAWVVVDIGGNWTGTEFYHDYWLNAAMFNYNLTGFDNESRPVAYWIKTRAWWMLSEWIEDTYTPPSWWTYDGYPLNIVNWTGALPAIEENETCLTWNRIWSGENQIYLISRPYTNHFQIWDPVTLQPWDSSDDAYSHNLTENYEIIINPPENESMRGYNQEYDWQTSQWWGCWLIASSNCSENINRTYADFYGDHLVWFNVTEGYNYRGVILNNSLISDSIYDVAILLPTFNYDYSFKADIQIWNATCGIQWYLGYGLESDITVFKSL